MKLPKNKKIVVYSIHWYYYKIVEKHEVIVISCHL